MKFPIYTIAALTTAVSAQYGAQYQPQQPQRYQPQPYQQYQPTIQQNKYSPAEAAAWHSRVDGFLDQFNEGHEKSGAACSFWTCLETTATKYNRGGALASIGGALNLVCKSSSLLPSFL